MRGNDQAGEAKSLGHKLRGMVDRVIDVDDIDVAVRRTRQRVSEYFLEPLKGGSQGVDQKE